jgi:diketogulonate reductase-like aldo/keto reductase
MSSPAISSGLQQTYDSPVEGLSASTVFNNGVHMPWLGLGVWRAGADAETERAVATALERGYRSIDTAAAYENERGVGRGLRASGVRRENVFITTKVWNDDVREHGVEAAFEESLRKLKLDYVDLYLVHWAVTGEIVSAWHAMEKIYRTGRAKAIGVCNHMIPHLDELLRSADVFPAVNQIEFHPYLQSEPLVEYCRGRGIQVEAWSPLMQGGEALRDPALNEIALAHGKSVAQVILRWLVQRGIVAIPKSTHSKRIEENAAIFDFALTDAQISVIAARNRDHRVGPDPMRFNF